MRYIGEEGIAFGSVAAAIVVQAVADDEARRLYHTVVTRYLVEYLLRHGNVGSLVLHYAERFEGPGVDHGVGAARHGVECQRHLVGHKHTWESTLRDEEIDEMLAHPFLGSESHPASAQLIEHLEAAPARIIVATDADIESGKI